MRDSEQIPTPLDITNTETYTTTTIIDTTINNQLASANQTDNTDSDTISDDHDPDLDVDQVDQQCISANPEEQCWSTQAPNPLQTRLQPTESRQHKITDNGKFASNGQDRATDHKRSQTLHTIDSEWSHYGHGEDFTAYLVETKALHNIPQSNQRTTGTDPIEWIMRVQQTPSLASDLLVGMVRFQATTRHPSPYWEYANHFTPDHIILGNIRVPMPVGTVIRVNNYLSPLSQHNHQPTYLIISEPELPTTNLPLIHNSESSPLGQLSRTTNVKPLLRQQDRDAQAYHSIRLTPQKTLLVLSTFVEITPPTISAYPFYYSNSITNRDPALLSSLDYPCTIIETSLSPPPFTGEC